jgi:hypothetical protein
MLVSAAEADVNEYFLFALKGTLAISEFSSFLYIDI